MMISEVACFNGNEGAFARGANFIVGDQLGFNRRTIFFDSIGLILFFRIHGFWFVSILVRKFWSRCGVNRQNEDIIQMYDQFALYQTD
jgi:hypothetical protein